mgnify:CR=1 FL=1
MTPEQWQRITAVFHDALARAPSSRDAFLDDACAGDRGIRVEVDRLLAAHQGAGRFGEMPGQALAAMARPGPATEAALPISNLPGPSAVSPDEDASLDPPISRGSASGLRARPFLTVVWAAAAATFLAFSYAGWLLTVNGGAGPAFGWTEAARSGQWFVLRVDPDGPVAGQLRQGDRLIDLNGIPPSGRTGTRAHRRALSVGDEYHLAIDRRGERITLVLRVAKDPSVIASNLTYFFVSLGWCLVGLFIGLARPEQPVARPRRAG